MFYYYPYYLHLYYLCHQYFYNSFYPLSRFNYMNSYHYSKKVLSPKHQKLYRQFSIEYIRDWFSNKYDEYKQYLFKCFYKYPYEFEKVKKCLKEEYNVPSNIAENITDIAQYGYETAGWSDKKIMLNKLSGEWQTPWGILKLYVSEDLVPTGDEIFPYANKITGSYDWNGGGKIEGSVNWGGVANGIFIEPNTQGEFKLIFENNSNGKRTFRGDFTENDENYKWEGEQIREY